MAKKFVVTVMLGMNRFSQEDTDHPFDMDFLKGYNKIWMPQLENEEKKCSTPFYEVGKTIDNFVNENSQLTKDDVFFIFGRGTIGSDSEDRLAEALLEARRTYGEDAHYIIYSKSFGVIDTLRAFRQTDMKRFKIDLMFAIDGYATALSRKSVTKKYRVKGRRQRRLIIPDKIKKVYAVVQRRKGFNGINAGRPSDAKCRNKTIRPRHVDEIQKYYDHYSDGYRRRLDVEHFNMEEIVSVIPCCSLGGKEYTVNDIIKKSCYKYMG